MNIMFLIYSFNTGGIERQLIEMSALMSEQGHDVTLCVINRDYTDDLFDELDSRVRIVKLDKTPGKSSTLPCMLRFSRLVRELHTDILHCQGINCVIFSAFARIASPNMAILNTVHDVGNYPSYSGAKIFVQNRICDMTIAISRPVEREILSRNLPSSRVTTINNAINTEKFQPSAAVGDGKGTPQAWSAISIDESCQKRSDQNRAASETGTCETHKSVIRICNVARFYPKKKGQDLLITAVEQLLPKYPGLVCSFAGEPAPGQNQEKVYQQMIEDIDRKGLAAHFEFAGNVKDVPAFLSDKDIFVLPSRYEGFGISLIEAMSMGIPVAASRLDGPMEIVCDNSYGELFEPGSADDLAAKLRIIIEKLPYYDHTEIRDYVCRNFSITSMVDQHIRLYQKLLSDKRR